MSANITLSDRMKDFYENRFRTYLPRKSPVIIRVDGKKFSNFTRHFEKPFDNILSCAMQETMKKLCANIQGCVLGYTQSDEISLVLIDYQTENSDAWFDYNLQKMISIAASMATLYFNKAFTELAGQWISDYYEEWNTNETKDKLCKAYEKAIETGALFDARAFVVPRYEVVNCLLWRQQDATRNSIEMLGRAYFSDKQLFKKNGKEIQDMLMLEKGVNWNNLPTKFKRGSCVYKTSRMMDCVDKKTGENTVAQRSEWVIDNEIPIFSTSDGKDYVNSRILFTN